MSNKTIDYYNQNADSFVQGTVSVDFKKTQDKFLRLLTGKTILDFGCGSGRDTKYFLESGFDVTATDGSEELCKSASAYTGIQVKHMLTNPFEKFERKRFLYYSKDLSVISMNHALYSQMEAEDWNRVRTQLQEDLKNYYSEIGGI